MSKLQPIRGTKDLYLDDAEQFERIIEIARDVARLFDFSPFHTPIFESTDVFSRTLGESSDVVNKEMYSFESRGGESLTLRPEFTAGIARAFISNGLQQHLPLKAFSYGPLFRYERPQKGRQRQFHQLNFEYIGEANWHADFVMIGLAKELLSKLGIEDYNLHINSLGDEESRAAYRTALVDYLTPYKNDLSEDSQRRLEVNPLRILDSKDAGDKKITTDAPKMGDYLNDASKEFFDTLLHALDELLQIQPVIDPTIVRGLDYYNHTVFEFISDSDELGAQNTILAGGRYDGLIKQLGGPDTPAVGFAAGIERLMLLANSPTDAAQKVAVLDLKGDGLAAAQMLRNAGIAATIISSGNLGKRMQKADKASASHAFIIFEDGVTKLKNMQSGDEKEASLQDAITELS